MRLAALRGSRDPIERGSGDRDNTFDIGVMAAVSIDRLRHRSHPLDVQGNRRRA